jgi:hypothetical protein
VIEQNRAARGWLIFATHDVCNAPTAYGCTPGLFEDIVECSVRSGARIIPVAEASDSLRASDTLHESAHYFSEPRPKPRRNLGAESSARS